MRKEFFRKGDRAEYLANYFLSHIGFISSFDRQEDFGIDFYCTVTDIIDNDLIPSSPFLIQVKSSKEPFIYGRIKNNKWYKEDIDWLFKLELPLFIGLISVKELTFNIYNTSSLWFIEREYKNASQIKIATRFDYHNISVGKPTSEELPNWKYGGDGKIYTVDLGNPIVSIHYNDLLDREKISTFKSSIKKIVKFEQSNIILKKQRIPYFQWVYQNIPNDQNPIAGVIYYDNEPEIANPEVIIESISQQIISLALALKLNNRTEDLDSVKKIIKLIPESKIFDILINKHPDIFK